jgi:hypothetical protein
MHFLSAEEVKHLTKGFDHQIDDQGRPKATLYYESRNRDYSEAANYIVDSIGPFKEAVLLFSFCISGDGFGPGDEADARWMQYRRWRAAQGEGRRLYEAPGHLFYTGEADDLARLVSFSLHLGWDAHLAANPKRQLMLLSHDDRIEIYRGFQRRLLSEQLLSLGYWRVVQ